MGEGCSASKFQFTISEALVASLMLGFAVSVVVSALSQESATTIFKAVLSFSIPAVIAFFLAVFQSRRADAGTAASLWRIGRLQLLSWPIGLVLLLVSADRLSRKRAPIAGASMCKAIQEYQEIYHRMDYDGDGVFEYSPTLAGLYETKPGAQDLIFVTKVFADAESTLPAPKPYHGFVFTVLTAQGKNAPGGAKSYIDASGNMTGGYAIFAYPSPYNPNGAVWGRSCYMIESATGTIYMRDFGTQTPVVAPTISEFNPDTNWGLCP